MRQQPFHGMLSTHRRAHGDEYAVVAKILAGDNNELTNCPRLGCNISTSAIEADIAPRSRSRILTRSRPDLRLRRDRPAAATRQRQEGD